MPLSPPAERELLHTRRVECLGYRRADGFWDIEATIIDTKTYAFSNQWRGEVTPGMPLHSMALRLTIDENFVIQAAEAITEASPHQICTQAAPPMSQLKGLKIGPGWMKAVKARVGGTHGCTHLVELLGPVATTAFQTLYPVRKFTDKPSDGRRPAIVDSCWAWSSEREIVRDRWPEFYKAPTTSV